ncbi:cell division protein ZipA [Psychromonas ossibalaenae]|uniref:cell division protein ZipA n=1 Tax=Psychromonas ossibalaenae TaxID=444922 RepID=UPI0003748BC5|nr:cell division protein ZipA [Psychromonas ossibalaenae]
MQHFQPILIAIGLLAIAAVLIHGYLLSRKEKMQAVENTTETDIFSEKSVTPETEEGIIGDVRIISDKSDRAEQSIDFSVALDDEKEVHINFSPAAAPVEKDSFDIQSVDTAADEPRAEVQHELVLEVESSETQTADDNNDKLENPAKPDQVLTEAPDEVVEHTVKPQVAVKGQVQEPDIFIFNVVAKGEGRLRGHELLQFFLTAGFRFGEMSIFHRHLHSDGTGPVLFSIANMMAPGIFEPEHMEQFNSEGVSFFLTVPNNEINVKEAFDMMLTAVEQMAEEFNCLVLNAEREPLTEQQFRNYHERLLHYI